MNENKNGSTLVVSPVFRVLAAVLAVLCTPVLVVVFLVEGIRSWKFLFSGPVFLVLMVYVAATGKAPSCFPFSARKATKKANQASDATSEPAQDADSSPHQG